MTKELPGWAKRALSEKDKPKPQLKPEERVIPQKVYPMKDGSFLVPSDYGYDRYTPDMVCECGECPMCKFYEKIEARWNECVPSRQALLADLAENQPEWARAIELHMRMCWQVVFETAVEELPKAIMPEIVKALKEEGFVSLPTIAEEISTGRAVEIEAVK